MQQRIDTLVQHYRSEGPVVLLESQSAHHPASQKSYLAARPKAIIKAWGNTIEISSNDSVRRFDGNPWSALQSFREQHGDWLFGYLGYDLKNFVEKLESKNPDQINAPDLLFMVPGILLEIDTSEKSIKSIRGSLPENIGEDKTDERIAIENLKSSVTKDEYITKIEEAQQQIYEGSCYEINLSHQLQGEFRGDAFSLYKKMRAAGPVPFGSYMEFDGYAISGFSPERFLRKSGRTVFSQPIKGTMERDDNPEKDRLLKQKLLDSGKDRAENLMIVDLVRNDLSRIARPDSVKVHNLFEIQTFGTVHQMVSTIEAETDCEDPVEVIKACFPMGSMTGAPKISAMQWIEKLENYRRGIYSGAIGYFTPDGDFDFNVVIRTGIIHNNELYYAVGGAITGDSDPESEWKETILKSKALTASLDC